LRNTQDQSNLHSNRFRRRRARCAGLAKFRGLRRRLGPDPRPDGGFDLIYATPGTKKGTREPTRASALLGGAFGPGTALTAGAHAGTIAAAETAAGNLAILYTDSSKASLMAINSSPSGFTAPVKLAASAVPTVQAGGGTVNAAWCLAACFASTLVLP